MFRMPDAGTSCELPTDAEQRRDVRIAAILVATGTVLTSVFALISPEGVHHFDDLTHYLYSEWSWQWPAYLLDDWGRPGCTALYFLPAALGWPACRLLSALLSGASAWLAFRIAQRMGLRHAWLVAPLCYVQPLFFGLAQTTLTETPLMFYWTLAAYLAQRGRWSWSALFVSIGCVTRHEAVLAVPIWLFVAWRQQAPLLRLWPIVVAPLLVNGLAPLADIKPQWRRLLETEASGQYGRGGWLTFFARSMEAWGLGVALLAISGWPRLYRLRWGLLPALLIAVYFAAQTAIRALGLFDSGGYARFLVPISPFVAISALVGWQWLNDASAETRLRATLCVSGVMLLLYLSFLHQMLLFEERGALVVEVPLLHEAKIAINACTAVLVMPAAVMFARGGSLDLSGRLARWLSRYSRAAVVAVIVLTAAATWRPLPVPEEATMVDEMRSWLDEAGLSDRPVIASHVWVNYKFGLATPQDVPPTAERVEDAGPGTLIIWDQQFADTPDHGLDLGTMLSSGAYRELHKSRPKRFSEAPQFIILEKTTPEGRRANRSQEAKM
jgi:hypothetical protein